MPTQHRRFTPSQQELLTSVLNRITPAEGQLPGAGDLGIAEFVENAIAHVPQLCRLFLDGLTQIEIAGSEPGVKFSQLSGEDQDAALQRVEDQHSAFFSALVRQCYNGYYTNPQICQLIGYRRPSPEDYEYKPIDPSLLEPQRQRAPFWIKA